MFQKKVNNSINKILENGRCVLLAYDHGMEHGPEDFSGENYDPNFIIDIAKKSKLNGIILQKGIAEKYYDKKCGIPLIVKLNGKTNISKGEPISRQICSVSEAIKLGAVAVGYTIYIGSEHETEMLQEFGKIEEEAHKKGIAVIAWMYPRGKSVKKVDSKIVQYCARVGLEIGADFVKVHYLNNFSEIVKTSGKCRVLALGGKKTGEKQVLEEARKIRNAGAIGMAIGRNVWQNKNPVEIAKKIKEIIVR